MDNEAFRALVTERSKEKSTKEIAREAVEEEFRSRQSRSRAAGGRKRRRAGAGGGGGGGGSSSDEDGGGGAASDDDDSDDGDVRRKEEADNDDENDGDEKEPKWKRERRAKKRAKDEAEGKIRYRDRAKERREGRTNADYAGIDAGEAAVAGADADSSSNVLGGADAEADNMTKYLGGDESRTHLVKGLDLALAEKVRREEMGTTDDAHANAPSDDVNLESILQSSRAERSDQEALRRAIQDLPSVATMSSSSSDGNRLRADVVGLLNRLQSASQTTLGRDMAAFLVNKTNRGYGGSSSSDGDQATELVVTNAGRTLQRTQLQFSLQCHPGDILRSWEVPREEVSSVADHDRRRRQSGGGADAPFGRKLTPLDGKFLARMKDALAPSMPTTPSDDKMSGASKKGRDGRKKSKHKGAEGRRGEEVTDTVANAGRLEHSSDAAVQVQPSAHTRNGNSGDGESSDDDIFGGIGTYQPSVPATAAAASNGGNRDTDNDTAAAAKKKKSIFAGLTAASETVDKPKRESAPVSNATAVRSTDESNVIDRDVFGARPMGAGASSAGGHRPSGGVSMSTSDYAGGYGEEMDTDFAGADDQEMEQSKRDKGGNLTTTAALEYGRRSGGSTLDS